jgi:hypothetical protein
MRPKTVYSTVRSGKGWQEKGDVTIIADGNFRKIGEESGIGIPAGLHFFLLKTREIMSRFYTQTPGLYQSQEKIYNRTIQ